MHPVIWLSVCPFLLTRLQVRQFPFHVAHVHLLYMYILFYFCSWISLLTCIHLFSCLFSISLSLSLSSILLSLSLSFLDSVIPFCMYVSMSVPENIAISFSCLQTSTFGLGVGVLNQIFSVPSLNEVILRETLTTPSTTPLHSSSLFVFTQGVTKSLV